MFTLINQEGRLFKPLAYSKTFAMAIDALLAITLAIAFIGLLSIIPAFIKLGSEFMPTLHEGSLLYMPTALPGISVSEAQRILSVQGKILKTFPEVYSVFGKAVRAETSTDTAPLSMIETTITLKPKTEWIKKERFYSFLPIFLKYCH